MVPAPRKREKKWEESFKELRHYKKEHGDSDVPAKWGPLGLWEKNQRRSKKGGFLNVEREAKLEKLGFKWRIRSARKGKTPKKVPGPPSMQQLLTPVEARKKTRRDQAVINYKIKKLNRTTKRVMPMETYTQCLPKSSTQ